MKLMLASVALLALAIAAPAQQSQRAGAPSATRNDQPVLAGRYITVRVELGAEDGWADPIREAFEAKLNAIPDVQTIQDADQAMFTIDMDVRALTDEKGHVLGYSLAAIIYGNYDRKLLSAIFDEVPKSGDPSQAAAKEFMQYAISGTVFLVGKVHAYGSKADISHAYDDIISELRSNGLSEFRKMLTMLYGLLREPSKIASSIRL